MPRPPRTPVELTETERLFVDQARGDTPIGTFIRRATLAYAAYELGRRSANPGRTIAAIVRELQAERDR
jgi:hypothetical protein